MVTDTNPAKALLAWFPNCGGDPKARLNNCSLLWSLYGSNESVIVDGELTGCKKERHRVCEIFRSVDVD